MPKAPLNLKRFLERVDLLGKSTFLHYDYNHFVREFLSEDDVNANGARELLESYITRLRPFLVEEESVSVKRVLRHMQMYEKDTKTLELVSKVQLSFKMLRDQAVLTFSQTTKDSEVLTPDDLFWYLVYGEYLHTDENKRQRNEEIDESFQSARILFALSHAESYGRNVLFTGAVLRHSILGQYSPQK